MKKYIHLFIVSALLCQQLFAQQQFVQTVTAQNTACNTQCSVIDVPGFTYDPNALVFATPVLEKDTKSKPSLIGALYRTYERKWSIFNLNGAAMTAGTRFNLEYYPKEDANHFVLITPRRLHSSDDVYIDHAGLNNNPDAQIRIFPTNPNAGNSVFNINEVQVVYVPSASKWIIANKAGGDVPSGVAYNIMFKNGSPTSTNVNMNKDLDPNIKTPVSIIDASNANTNKDINGNPKIPVSNVDATNANTNKDLNGNIQTPVTNNGAGGNCNCPKSLPPDGDAGGDLRGTYPDPMVTALLGRNLSSKNPKEGDVLKWNGQFWEPASGNNNVNPSVISFKQSSNLDMNIPNVDEALISGLDNQSFPVNQTCFIVFHAAIHAQVPLNIYEPLGTALVNASVTVEIFDSANKLVASATNESILGKALQTMVVIGQAILSPGRYHTRVTMSRGMNGSRIMAYGTSSGNPSILTNSDKGGELFIEVFPWNSN